ncbi:small conductance mechanosensitive channel [Litorivivens lipolytica]|uniref:Small-conductance mechanosensitive channel n=1 Tax=Litorivivens lipolytica TaxID=1524264 RepID=A0A7W4Z5J1_9GAMM|nr:mechanosensitive ion channel family protein [Litorivivens lipolytica]MBB3047539.1 small conductance mechanosensitive channel [Litorivivens lipolytica]
MAEKDWTSLMNQELKDFQKIYDQVAEFFVNYSFQLVGALIILIIGLFIASRVGRMVQRLCERNRIDVTLSRFLGNVAKVAVTMVVAIICLGKIGISVGPFLAAVGAVSLGAGLAVQGLLSNYSAGLNIVITRPFVVGDTISVQGVTGVVDEIRLAYTLLEDEDGVRILIPNRHIIGEIIHNSDTTRLADTIVGVAYESDIGKAIAVIRKVLADIPEIEESTAQVGLDAFADSSINLSVRFWIPTRQFHAVRFRVNQGILDALREAGIVIAFPQREVRLLSEES